jgi:hypothetical protein
MRSRSKGWWMAARTEVLLGESPHDPRARGAGFSFLGRTHFSRHRGDFKGFGCVPGLSAGVAPDGDDAPSRPPQPDRDDGSEFQTPMLQRDRVPDTHAP